MTDLGDAIAAETTRLRRYAARLTSSGNPNVDDMVQDCFVRALSRKHQFEPGTNLRAWLMTILRSQFVETRRRPKRVHVPLSDALGLAAPERADISAIVAEVVREIAKLPPAWVLALAATTGACAEGVKVDNASVFRARRRLRQVLDYPDLETTFL